MDRRPACLAAALLVWLLASLALSPPRLRLGSWPPRTFSHLHWHWVALSLVPMLGTYSGRALRWAVFLKPLKPHPSMRNLLSATVMGFTAITLFGRPGEFVRPYLIARKEQVPVTSQFAAWVLERIFDLLMALLLFAFALTRVQSSGLHVGDEAHLGAGRRAARSAAPCVAIILLVSALPAPLRRTRSAVRLIGALRHLPEPNAPPGSSGLSTRSSRAWNPPAATPPCLLVLVYSVLEWVLICALLLVPGPVLLRDCQLWASSMY